MEKLRRKTTLQTRLLPKQKLLHIIIITQVYVLRTHRSKVSPEKKKKLTSHSFEKETKIELVRHLQGSWHHGNDHSCKSANFDNKNKFQIKKTTRKSNTERGLRHAGHGT